MNNAQLKGHAPSKHPTHLNNPNLKIRDSDNEYEPEYQRQPPKGITHNHHHIKLPTPHLSNTHHHFY